MPRPSASTWCCQYGYIVAEQNREQLRRYNEAKHEYLPPVRPVLVDPEMVQRGTVMAEQRKAIAERRPPVDNARNRALQDVSDFLKS